MTVNELVKVLEKWNGERELLVVTEDRRKPKFFGIKQVYEAPDGKGGAGDKIVLSVVEL